MNRRGKLWTFQYERLSLVTARTEGRELKKKNKIKLDRLEPLKIVYPSRFSLGIKSTGNLRVSNNDSIKITAGV